MIEPVFNSRAEIEEHQLRALREVISSVRDRNAFWTPRLQSADIDAGVESLDQFTRSMPLLTKAELSTDQQTFPPYGTNLTFPVEQYARLHQTSSTTGAPIRWLDTTDDWNWMIDSWQIVLEAAGVTAGDRVFITSSFGPFIGFWIAWDAAIRMGCMAIPGGGMASNTRLRTILANNVTILCCSPTYAIHLGETARKDAIDLSSASVRRIIVAGEPGGSVPAVRKRIERLWPRAQVFDHHGMTETGPVTFGCPKRPGVLHVIESAYLCEIVRPESGGTMDPTENALGELVISTLGRSGCPLFRYRTGDLVQVERDGVCQCGRSTMRFIGGILSRIDDMVIVRGTNVYPGAVASVLATFETIVEYEVHIDDGEAMTEIVVLIEPRPDTNNDDLAVSVASALRDAFNLRFDVRLVDANSLPRYEFKERRWRKHSKAR